MKMCEVCHEYPAEVPDREKPGRPINRVCLICHSRRLKGDLRRVKRDKAKVKSGHWNAKSNQNVIRGEMEARKLANMVAACLEDFIYCKRTCDFDYDRAWMLINQAKGRSDENNAM